MVIVKLYFTTGSRMCIAWQWLSKIELSATKVNGFQCKAIAINSSVIDIAGVPDPPLITIIGKVTFNLTQANVILFNLIAVYGRSYLYSNYEWQLIFLTEYSCYRLRTNSVRQKFSLKMTFSASYCRKELLLRCWRHSGFASDGNTWQNIILIWRKQPSKLIQ